VCQLAHFNAVVLAVQLDLDVGLPGGDSIRSVGVFSLGTGLLQLASAFDSTVEDS